MTVIGSSSIGMLCFKVCISLLVHIFLYANPTSKCGKRLRFQTFSPFFDLVKIQIGWKKMCKITIKQKIIDLPAPFLSLSTSAIKRGSMNRRRWWFGDVVWMAVLVVEIAPVAAASASMLPKSPNTINRRNAMASLMLSWSKYSPFFGDGNVFLPSIWWRLFLNVCFDLFCFSFLAIRYYFILFSIKIRFRCRLYRRLRYQFIHLCCFVVVSSSPLSLMMPKVSNKNRKRASTNAIWPRSCVCRNFFSLSFRWHSIEIKCFVRNFIEFFHILWVDGFLFRFGVLSIHSRLFDMEIEFTDSLMGVRVRAHVFSALSINVCHVCVLLGVFISFVGFGYCFLFIKTFCPVDEKINNSRSLRSVFSCSFSLASSFSSKVQKMGEMISSLVHVIIFIKNYQNRVLVFDFACDTPTGK